MATSQKPRWLKVKMPGSPRYHAIKKRARELKLATVCEEARCPNIGECWAGGTATFMVMGDTCTRGCHFCSVKTAARPAALDPMEPFNLAQAVAELDLDYIVITSVDRDDVHDGGASHFAACIEQVHAQSPGTKVEVLTGDFQGHLGHLLSVVMAQPEVFAHNVEAVERLCPTVRDPRASYRQSMSVLANVKTIDPTMLTKSSIMVGLGERESEVVQTMRDLRDIGVDFLTIGQYLKPAKGKQYLEIQEWIPPEQFKAYEQIGRDLGFAYVASGPLVRSSYKAGEFFISRHIDQRRADVS
ncbi:MAG: lipoyl synthase [Deltaproteobacteria bacterium]|nr:MAG: lipoyl synthase [Deltaproteobacteria bacterium]